MSSFSERLQRSLAASGLKQTDIAEATGISKAAISSYLSGKYEPKQGNIYKLAEALRISPGLLLGAWEKDGSQIGTAGSGDGTAEEDFYFEFTVLDNTMSPLLLPGDILRVQRQLSVPDGALAVVRVGGEEPMVRRLSRLSTGLIISTYNIGGIPSTGYSSSEIESLPVEILGRVVEMRRAF